MFPIYEEMKGKFTFPPLEKGGEGGFISYEKVTHATVFSQS